MDDREKFLAEAKRLRGDEAIYKLMKAIEQVPDEVMVYLAESSGFYQTRPFTLSHSEMMYIEGRRSLFAELLHFKSLPLDAKQRLERRAIEEARVTSVAGPHTLME